MVAEVEVVVLLVLVVEVEAVVLLVLVMEVEAVLLVVGEVAVVLRLLVIIIRVNFINNSLMEHIMVHHLVISF